MTLPSPISSARRGLFILFEGCDRTGKSTQVRLLSEALARHGHSVDTQRFPDRTSPLGKVISNYLSSSITMDDHAIHLLFSANRWEALASIEERLLSGQHVIVDRYSASGIAYSAAKGLNIAWCTNPDKGLLRPDIVFLLDQPISSAIARGGWGEERYEEASFQGRVREVFLKLVDPSWKIIDAAQAIDKVHQDIIIPVLEAVNTGPDPKPLDYTLWE